MAIVQHRRKDHRLPDDSGLGCRGGGVLVDVVLSNKRVEGLNEIYGDDWGENN